MNLIVSARGLRTSRPAAEMYFRVAFIDYPLAMKLMSVCSIVFASQGTEKQLFYKETGCWREHIWVKVYSTRHSQILFACAVDIHTHGAFVYIMFSIKVDRIYWCRRRLENSRIGCNEVICEPTVLVRNWVWRDTDRQPLLLKWQIQSYSRCSWNGLSKQRLWLYVMQT